MSLNSSGNFHETAVKDAEAILKLHSMDEERFLKTGEIVTDPNLLKDYEDDFGGKSLEETARARSQDMLCSLNGVSFPLEERVIQALLLKMTIIKMGQGGILEKLKMLREFMEDELNVVLTPEYYLAIFYFSDSTGNFIPNIQKKVNIERAFVKIQATTWDLLLLRIPAMQLKMHSDDYTQLGFISTADSSFAKIASQFIIGGIIPLPHNKTIDCDMFLYKREKIIEILGADTLTLFERFNWEKTKYRQIGKLYNRATGKPEKELNLAELDNLIEELKDKFRNLCRK